MKLNRKDGVRKQSALLDERSEAAKRPGGPLKPSNPLHMVSDPWSFFPRYSDLIK